VGNVAWRVDGNTLTITIDFSREYGESSSGRDTVIASTLGNVRLPRRDE